MLIWVNVDSSGSVSILAINLGNTSSILHFDSFNKGGKVDIYILHGIHDPGSSLDNGTGLLGTGIALNGIQLMLRPDGTIPPLEPKSISSNSIELYGESIGFFVLREAGNAACSQ